MKLFVDEKRQYPRVKVSLPVQFRLLNGGEYEQIEGEFIQYPTPERRKRQFKSSGVVEGLEGGEKLRNLDVVILQTLNLINQKLDLLLEHLNLNMVASISDFRGESIDLSGSGMRFISDNSLSRNDKVELSFELPSAQISTHRNLSSIGQGAFSLKTKTQIGVLAEVVKSTTEESKFVTAVEFCAINEVDREDIARYCMERHQILSKKRIL